MSPFTVPDWPLLNDAPHDRADGLLRAPQRRHGRRPGAYLHGKDEEEEGTPITLGASHIDGLALSLTPNSHSYNYRSAVLCATELITNSVTATVLCMKIGVRSAKLRSGMLSDEKVDPEDGALTERVWTGVVLVSYRIGGPIAGPCNKVDETPKYVEESRGSNGYAKETAVKNARKKMAGKKKRND
ncbi:hypothetical protein DL771_009675 [Monosporascus sp. 5C6A]|nr:hypothetical protein DL771_009675 [Monosporascus sp. 5C6A]